MAGRRILFGAILLCAACATDSAIPAAQIAASAAGESCTVTPAQQAEARALEWQEFDQAGDAPGSFRVLADGGCPHAALAAYDDWLGHGIGFPDSRARGIGNFHRAQLLEINGRHEEALALFRQSFREQSEDDPRADVWNTYLSGVLGFFAGSADAIRTAQSELAANDDAFAQRQVGILQGLLTCIGRPYRIAMSHECQPG
jgi:hypothetical protein